MRSGSKNRSRDWKAGEVPHVEMDHVEFPGSAGGPIVFHLTPRGAREKVRRDRAFAREQARIKKDIARGRYGIPADWIVRGIGAARHWG